MCSLKVADIFSCLKKNYNIENIETVLMIFDGFLLITIILIAYGSRKAAGDYRNGDEMTCADYSTSRGQKTKLKFVMERPQP